MLLAAVVGVPFLGLWSDPRSSGRSPRAQAAGSASRSAHSASGTDARRPVVRYRFVSTPDAWNNDIGDVRRASGWSSGKPNSINGSWRRAIDAVLDDIALRAPRFVLVAGDQIGGRWDDDLDGVATFGVPTTVAGRRRAVREAASIYYPQWRAQFGRHGLRVRPAVGDHEIGDDNWFDEHEQALVRTFRHVWAREFTYRRGRAVYPSHPPRGAQHARTAYAFRSGPVFFVTVDVFHQRPDGRVHATVAGAQLRWLRRALRAANRDPSVRFIVVQGHTPVLPARFAVGSSRLRLKGRWSSPFWRTLERNEVDLYLCGEAHAISTANRGGVEQVAHGSNVGFGWFNYLTVAVSPQRLWLTLRRAPVRRDTDARLWQSGVVRPWASRRVGRFSVVGTMSITADGREHRRKGMFRARTQRRRSAPGPGSDERRSARLSRLDIVGDYTGLDHVGTTFHKTWVGASGNLVKRTDVFHRTAG